MKVLLGHLDWDWVLKTRTVTQLTKLLWVCVLSAMLIKTFVAGSCTKAVHHILTKLHLLKAFLGVSFANRDLPEEKTNILISKTKLSIFQNF